MNRTSEAERWIKVFHWSIHSEGKCVYAWLKDVEGKKGILKKTRRKKGKVGKTKIKENKLDENSYQVMRDATYLVCAFINNSV